MLLDNKIKIFDKSKDGLTPLEVCSGKWQKVIVIIIKECLSKIIDIIDQKHMKFLYSDTKENKITQIDTLRNNNQNLVLV